MQWLLIPFLVIVCRMCIYIYIYMVYEKNTPLVWPRKKEERVARTFGAKRRHKLIDPDLPSALQLLRQAAL